MAAGHPGLDPHVLDPNNDVDRNLPGAERQLRHNEREANAGCFDRIRQGLRRLFTGNAPGAAAAAAAVVGAGRPLNQYNVVHAAEDLPDPPSSNDPGGYTAPPAAQVRGGERFFIGGDQSNLSNYVLLSDLTGKKAVTTEGIVLFELTGGRGWMQPAEAEDHDDDGYVDLRLSNPAKQDQSRKCSRPSRCACFTIVGVLIILAIGGSILGAYLGGAFKKDGDSGVDPEPDDESGKRDGGGDKGVDFDVIAKNTTAKKVSGTVKSVVLILDTAGTEGTSSDVHSAMDMTQKIGTWTISGSTIHFTPESGVIIRTDPSVSIGYKFTDDKGKSNTGKATLTFTDDPIAVPVTLPEATDGTMPARTDVVAAGFVKTGTKATVTLNNPSSAKGVWGVDGTSVTFLPSGGKGTDSVDFTISAPVTTPSGTVTVTSTAKATVNYNVAASSGTTPVAMNVTLSGMDRTGLSSAEIGAALQTAGTTVAAALQDPMNPLLFTKDTVQRANVGTWSIITQGGKVYIRFLPDAAFQGVTDSISFKVSTTSTVNGKPVTLTSQNSATAKVTIPAIGQTPPAAPSLTPAGGLRYAVTNVITGATGVEVVGDGQVTSSTGVLLGTWSVMNDNLQFSPAVLAGAPGRVLVYQDATAKTQYTVVVNGQRTTPGMVTLTFSDKPAVSNISGFKTAGTALDLNVLADAFVAEGVTAFEANANTKIEFFYNNAWRTDSDITFQATTVNIGHMTADHATGKITYKGIFGISELNNPPFSVPFRITDSNGAVSNEATATVTFMPMAGMLRARTMFMTGAFVNGKSKVADVAAAHPVKVDPKTVELVAAHQIGMSNIDEAAGLKKDGKELVVPGQGIWSVDATSGAIGFLPEDDLDEGVMPVSYSFSDTGGNPSTIGLLVVDPDDSVRSAVETAAKQSDSAFWTDLHKRAVDDPSQELEWDALLLVIQSMFAVTDHLMGPMKTDPISDADFKTGYADWKKKQYNDNLFAICEKMASSVAAQTTAPYEARFWRLKLMADMLTTALVESGR